MKFCRLFICGLGTILAAPACMPGGPVGPGPTPVREPGGSGGKTGQGGQGGKPSNDAGMPPPGSGMPGALDGGGSGGAGGDPGLMSDAGGPETAGGGADGGGTPERDGGGDAGPIVAGALARNLRLGLIEGTQGVFVPIARAGTAVPVADRKADLIEGRPLFLRVHVTPGAGFVARPLQAILAISSDGQATPALFEETKSIAAASRSVDLASTFNFLVPATAVLPSSRFAVSVHETTAVTTPPPEAAVAPRFPAPGQTDAPLAIKAGKMELDVVMVRATGVGGPLMDSPERRRHLEGYLYDVYPVQKLNVRWRDPVKFTKKITRNEGFSTLQQLRTMDGAKAHEYYHLLVAVEDTVETLLGIATLAGGTEADGPRRIGMTFVRKRQIDSEMDSVSHEMGHNHGRNHVAGCNAAGIDGMYPYQNTAVGVDGFSLTDKSFKPAAMYKDVMGYCYPTWISDYTFQGFARRVRAVTGFASGPGGAPVTMLAQRSLQGFALFGSGNRRNLIEGSPLWGIVQGALVDPGERPTAGRRARIVLRDGTRIDTAVSLRRLGDDDRGAEIAVTLPASGDLERIEIQLEGQGYILDEPERLAP
jgi:hypothetical protein